MQDRPKFQNVIQGRKSAWCLLTDSASFCFLDVPKTVAKPSSPWKVPFSLGRGGKGVISANPKKNSVQSILTLFLGPAAGFNALGTASRSPTSRNDGTWLEEGLPSWRWADMWMACLAYRPPLLCWTATAGLGSRRSLRTPQSESMNAEHVLNATWICSGSITGGDMQRSHWRLGHLLDGCGSRNDLGIHPLLVALAVLDDMHTFLASRILDGLALLPERDGSSCNTSWRTHRPGLNAGTKRRVHLHTQFVKPSGHVRTRAGVRKITPRWARESWWKDL